MKSSVIKVVLVQLDGNERADGLRLPFSEIKIDRSFVAELGHSCEAQAIVAAIIGMSVGLGMTTVAEGVEDLDTYMRLRDMGCYAAQGYFIARPMGAPVALAWSDSA